MNTDLLHSCIGSLVGVHVGDSIGAPYEETFKPAKIAEDIAARSGLTFFDYANPWAKDGNGAVLPAGRPTDDSEQTACLAASLIACNGLDTAHLYELLRASVFDQKSLLWSGRSTGAGGTTRNALSGDPVRMTLARTNTIGTNGSLMRSAPMGLWWATRILDFKDEKTRAVEVQAAKAMVFAMSDVTHAHPHSKDACWLYTVVLANLLAGNEPEAALLNVEYTDPTLAKSKLAQRMFLSIYDDDLIPYDPGAFPARGTAEFSLYVALYALKHSKTFAEGIEIAVRVGGDTDTYAAIAGGLLGAHYGYESIPLEWRQTILGHDVMVKLATDIYELRCKAD
jgi:ADP-ribosyl-[dinitrogen reductase] hydrolase